MCWIWCFSSDLMDFHALKRLAFGENARTWNYVWVCLERTHSRSPAYSFVHFVDRFFFLLTGSLFAQMQVEFELNELSPDIVYDFAPAHTVQIVGIVVVDADAAVQLPANEMFSGHFNRDVMIKVKFNLCVPERGERPRDRERNELLLFESIHDRSNTDTPQCYSQMM